MKTNNTKTICVKASTKYDVVIGENLIENVGEYVSKVIKECKVALITDDIVDNLYADTVTKSLIEKGFKVEKFVFKNGEQSKNLNTYAEILYFLAQKEFTRTDLVVALGGGVTGDMAGFASATFLRGIKYIQIPTTLLAQVDSSVGGKTAVDLPQGKNLVGAFKQPQLVICDTGVLSTLPKQIFIDGMGEVAKYAVLDQKICSLLESDDYDLSELVYLCVGYKRDIVEQDEFESGKRRLLNLGHTLAHGIEKLSNFTISHGKAVAYGLKIILDACLKNKLIDEKVYQKINNVIEKCVKLDNLEYDIPSICAHAVNDKKRLGDEIVIVTVHGVGDCRETKIKIEQLVEFLS